MRLGDLLPLLSEERLHLLADGKVDDHRKMSTALLAGTLESVLRSYGHVQHTLSRLNPPVFSICLQLVEAKDHRLSLTELQVRVDAETDLICQRLATGEILSDDHPDIYRRVLAEAWRTGLELDPSENALLGVLRHQLGMGQVDHFLTAHHPELQMFWKGDEAFVRGIEHLEAAGLLFSVEGSVVLPTELVPYVIRALGLDLRPSAARRLFGCCQAALLGDALRLGMRKTSGDKNERIERLLSNMVRARDVLLCAGIFDLRDLARSVGCPTSGSKDELIDRLLGHFDAGADLEQPLDTATVPERPPEPRVLSQDRFRMLFSALSGRELADILEHYPDLPQSGAKERRVSTLWEMHRSERNLLEHLTNRQLEEALGRIDLKTAGSKTERIERLIDYHVSAPPTSLTDRATDSTTDSDSMTEGEEPDDSR